MGRWLLRIVLILAVIAGVGVAADAVVRMLAEDQAATELRRQLQLPENPKVELGGFPFSMAVVTRSVPSARLDIATMPVEADGHALQLTNVIATTGAIRQDADLVTVDRAHVTGTLGYAGLSELVGVPVSHGGEGRLKLEYRTEVLGREVTASVSAVPVVESNQLGFDEPELTVVDVKLNGRILDELVDRLVQPIDIPLEHGLELTSLSPASGGVDVVVDGTGLEFELR